MNADTLPKSPRHGRWMVIALGLILLWAFALRVYGLGTQSLWSDEGYSVHLAGQSLPTILSDIVADHSPLYYVLLHFWILGAGRTEFALRFVSVSCGLLVVALTYALGRRIPGRLAGLLAAFLTAIAPLHVYYAQEARMHILVTALGLASVYGMVRLLDWHKWAKGQMGTGADWPAFAAYVLITAAGLWTFYYFALLILAQNVYATLYVLRVVYDRQRVGPLVRRWVLAQVGTIVLFAPWAAYAAPRVLESFRLRAPAFGFASVDLLTALRLCLETFSLGPTMDPGLALWLSLPLAALALFGLLTPGTRNRILLACWLGVPVLVAWLVNLRFPPFLPRYLLVATPAYYLLAAAGLMALLPARFRQPPGVKRQASGVVSRLTFYAGLLFLVTLSAGFSLHNNYHNAVYARDDYRAVAATIRHNSASDEVLVLNAWWQDSMFDYYNPGPLARCGIPEKGQLPDRTRTQASIAAVAGRHPAIWLCLYGNTAGDPDNAVEEWLNHHTTRVWEGWFGQVHLLRYLTPGAPGSAGPAHPIGSHHEGLVLLGLDIPATVEAGANIPVDLYWQAVGRTNDDYSVSLRLRDAHGRVWGQQDGEPLAGRYPTSTWPVGEQVRDRRLLLVPWGTPPGEYTLDVQVYAPGQLPEAPVPVQLRVLPSTQTPAPDDLALDRPVQADFDGLRLLGAGLRNPTARDGDPFQVDLLWQCLVPPAPGLRAVVELRDATGNPVTESDMPLEGAAGELRRQMHVLLIPATASDSHYRLRVALRQPGGSLIPVRWWFLPLADGADLGTIPVVGRPHNFQVPLIARPLSVQLDGVRLLGYDLKSADDSSVPRAGSSLRVVLYWQCTQSMTTSYTVFCHLVDSQGRLGPQQDDLPCLGQCPTTSWVPGEVLTDEHTIVLPANTPPGPYTLYVGMYNAQTMQRLGEAIVVGLVNIAPPP